MKTRGVVTLERQVAKKDIPSIMFPILIYKPIYISKCKTYHFLKVCTELRKLPIRPAAMFVVLEHLAYITAVVANATHLFFFMFITGKSHCAGCMKKTKQLSIVPVSVF